MKSASRYRNLDFSCNFSTSFKLGINNNYNVGMQNFNGKSKLGVGEL